MKTFRQAWELMRQRPLFCSIYIAGTALSVCMIMVIALYLHLQTGNIYPEPDRDRQLYLSTLSIESKDSTQYTFMKGKIGPEFVRQVCSSLETAEIISTRLHIGSNQSLTTTDRETPIQASASWVDDAYWRMYDFEVLAGRVFSKEEFTSGTHSAVICEALSRALFGEHDPIGKEFHNTNTKQSYTVVGVVRNVSQYMRSTYAHLWLPYSAHPNLDELTNVEIPLLGQMGITIRPTEAAGKEGVSNELAKILNDLEQSTGYRISLKGGLMSASDILFQYDWDLGEDNNGLWYVWGIILVFLFVPALNLSALNSSVMERRLSEIGVRKAFGAPNVRIFGHILLENFIYTAIGAIVGLAIAYVCIIASSHLILSNEFSKIDHSIRDLNPDLTWDMLFNAPIFFMTLLVALTLNTLASLLPILGILRRDTLSVLHNNIGDKR